MTAIAEPAGISAGWLRNQQFDRLFILGIAAVALLSGVVVVIQPALLMPIVVADLWLLGYHHVISTFTRLCFDTQSFREHRFLIFGLPLIVLAGVYTLIVGVGLWAVISLYLYWQWFHYTRQSWGISQVYRRKAGDLVVEGPQALQATFYLLPLWGILRRSHQNPDTFLGLEVRVIPVPELLVDVVAVAAIAALAWWIVGRFLAWRRGRLPRAHSLYMLSHFAIFYVGYIAIEDITAGWLVVNIWHNAQYIAFVWLYNNNRFKSGVDPKARFLSTISQARNFWRYLTVCLGLSTMIYFAIGSFLAAVVAPIVIFQAVNFHHYIVDGLIWKVRRKPMQRTLGIAS